MKNNTINLIQIKEELANKINKFLVRIPILFGNKKVLLYLIILYTTSTRTRIYG